MSDIAIKVEGIGKKYRIGQKKSGELRETFGNLIRTFWLSTNSQQPETQKDFWALKDISFEVKQGEAVGIIGRNGAGKSTLLKILSRITKPTTGRFEIDGRVSSLLEVGTGFHPELTGRENIYLNGTILGMKRREIKSKFDDIVAFSGVENFIDTPVKHYSSGMKVRLAFSVAAHLEPEILIIDEVLAVGDAEFQKKCLGKMEDVTGQGRTVLFVSHNMGAVKRLCKYGILLSHGVIEYNGNTEKTIQEYFASDDNNIFSSELRGEFNFKSKTAKNNNNPQGLLSATTFCNSVKSSIFFSGADIRICLFIKDNRIQNDPSIGFVIRDVEGNPLMGVNNMHTNNKLSGQNLKNGANVVIRIPSLPIYGVGAYSIDLFLGDGEKDHEIINKAIMFQIVESDIYNSGKLLSSSLNKMIEKNISFSIQAK